MFGINECCSPADTPGVCPYGLGLFVCCRMVVSDAGGIVSEIYSNKSNVRCTSSINRDTWNPSHTA